MPNYGANKLKNRKHISDWHNLKNQQLQNTALTRTTSLNYSKILKNISKCLGTNTK
jgi:hypothetical protein